MLTHNTCGRTGKARAVRRELFGTNCLAGPCWRHCRNPTSAVLDPVGGWKRVAEAVEACRVSNGFAGTRNAEAELDRWNSVAIFFETFLHAAREMRRRSVLPTAIGLMPPSFLASAHKDAPQKNRLNIDRNMALETQWAESQADDLHLLPIHWSGLHWSCRTHEELRMSPSLELATENPGRHETGVWRATPLPWRHRTELLCRR